MRGQDLVPQINETAFDLNKIRDPKLRIAIATFIFLLVNFFYVASTSFAQEDLALPTENILGELEERYGPLTEGERYLFSAPETAFYRRQEVIDSYFRIRRHCEQLSREFGEDYVAGGQHRFIFEPSNAPQQQVKYTFPTMFYCVNIAPSATTTGEWMRVEGQTPLSLQFNYLQTGYQSLIFDFLEQYRNPNAALSIRDGLAFQVPELLERSYPIANRTQVEIPNIQLTNQLALQALQEDGIQALLSYPVIEREHIIFEPTAYNQEVGVNVHFYVTDVSLANIGATRRERLAFPFDEFNQMFVDSELSPIPIRRDTQGNVYYNLVGREILLYSPSLTTNGRHRVTYILFEPTQPLNNIGIALLLFGSAFAACAAILGFIGYFHRESLLKKVNELLPKPPQKPREIKIDLEVLAKLLKEIDQQKNQLEILSLKEFLALLQKVDEAAIRFAQKNPAQAHQLEEHSALLDMLQRHNLNQLREDQLFVELVRQYFDQRRPSSSSEDYVGGIKAYNKALRTAQEAFPSIRQLVQSLDLPKTVPTPEKKLYRVHFERGSSIVELDEDSFFAALVEETQIPKLAKGGIRSLILQILEVGASYNTAVANLSHYTTVSIEQEQDHLAITYRYNALNLHFAIYGEGIKVTTSENTDET